MKQSEASRLLLRKAAQDEALLEAILSNAAVDDEVFGFHAQQAVEKLLKAWLVHLNVPYPHIDNLRAIIALLRESGRHLPADLSDLDALTPYATIHRYEDVALAAPFDGAQVREQVRRLRRFVE
jgi:HEPN domain-containing protein